MAFGEALLERAEAALTGAKAAYNNAVKGPDFNKEAYEEAQKKPGLGVEADCFCEEDWNWVAEPEKGDSSKSPSPLSSPAASQEIEPFRVRNTETLSQIRLKVTRAAATKASEAADVSLTYVKWALKFAVMEAAHDIAFLAHCRTVAGAVAAAKNRYPLLADLQRAYQSGMVDAGSFIQDRELRTWQPPRAGVNHPYDVKGPSNLDDIPIFPAQDGPVYDPATNAEVEYVYEPVVRNRLSKQNLRQQQQKNYLAAEPKNFAGEFDESDEFGGGGGVAVQSQILLRNMRSVGPYDSAEGPIIGSMNDSEERKAEQARKEERTQALVERMERRGSTAAVIERLRKGD